MKIKLRWLSKKEAKALALEAGRLYSGPPLLAKSSIGLAMVDGLESEIYIVGSVPCMFRWKDDRLYPTISCLRRYGTAWLKGVVLVDKGATIALSKGAHLMIPGVTGVEGSFSKGDVVAALYSETRAPVMVGIAELGSDDLLKLASEKSRGRAVTRIHRVGDQLWEACLEIEKKLH